MGVRAFNSFTLANVRAALSLAWSSQLAQQRNTGSPFSINLTGVPIEPRGLPVIEQSFCASANWRSGTLNLAKAALTSTSSAPAVKGREAEGTTLGEPGFAFLSSSTF